MASPTRLQDKWRIRWMDEASTRRSAVYPTHREATYQLKLREAEVAKIRRGLRLPAPIAHSLNDLCDDWLAHRTRRKRCPKDDHSIIRCHLRPAFGAMGLQDIGLEAIDAYKLDKRHLAPKTVANHLTLLVSMLNRAIDLGWLHKAPRVRKPKVRLFATDYRYLRTDQEIQRLLRAARQDGQDAFVLYATAIYTGMRQGELAALRWEDIRFDQRLIVVQHSFDGPTKAADVRYVPLLDVLLPILRDWRLRSPDPLLFPNQAGNMHQSGARIFRQRFHRILDSALFPRPADVERHVHAINFHGLRHTFASHWMMKGGDLFKLQKMLGHKSIEMTQRYAHLDLGAFVQDHGRFNQLALQDEGQIIALKPAGGSTSSA